MLRDRARSAAILVPPLLLALWLGGWLDPRSSSASPSSSARWEAFRLLTAAGHSSMPLLGIVLAVVVALGDSVKVLPGGSGILLAALGIVLIGIGALTRLDPREGLAVFATTTFGALYVGLLGFVARLAARPTRPSIRTALLGWLGPDRAWILALVLVVWAFDTAAYFTGRRFGRRPFMAPHLAVEDARGRDRRARRGRDRRGGARSSALRPAVRSPASCFGLIVGAAAQAGDLAESMLKRAAGAKESGPLIPGHGGMLDRVDSFLFAAPVAYFYVVAVLR